MLSRSARTRRPSDRSYLSVDWGNPVNLAHPLNQDLLFWHLAVHGSHQIRYVGSTTYAPNLAERERRLHTVDRGWRRSNIRPGTVWGQSIDFDTTTDGLDLPFDGPTDKTYMMWMLVDAHASSFNTLVEFGTDDPWFGLRASGVVEMFDNNPTSSEAVPTGEWFHLAYTSDSVSNVSKIYFNGVEKGSGIADTQTGLTGGIARHAGDVGFDGSMDDIRIYSRGLTHEEVLEYYHLSKVGWPGLLNRWGMQARSIETDAAAGGRTMSSLAGSGGLAGAGGIAGHGGGLAG